MPDPTDLLVLSQPDQPRRGARLSDRQIAVGKPGTRRVSRELPKPVKARAGKTDRTNTRPGVVVPEEA
jgi:hypothetical protein